MYVAGKGDTVCDVCAIWYHLQNLKNVKNTHGGVLLLVKLQAEATEEHSSMGGFHVF